MKKAELTQIEDKNSTESTTQNYLAFGLIIIFAVIGGVAGKSLPALSIPIGIGWLAIWLADWYVTRKNVSYVLIEIIAWLCLVAWLIPVIGLFAGIFIIRLNKSNANSKLKYYFLSYLCLALSAGNSILGILLNR